MHLFIKTALLLVLSLYSVDLQANPDNCQECCLPYAYNLPTRFKDNCCLWEGHFDFLYLEARDSFAPITVEEYAAAPLPLLIASADATPHEFSFDWQAGFRIGLGVQLPCDCFEVNLDWVHYKTRAEPITVTSSSPSTLLIPFGHIITSDTSIEDLSEGTYNANSELHLNQLNLWIGREYYLTEGIILEPKIGITYLDIKSNLIATFDPFVPAAEGSVGSSQAYLNVFSRFYGYGIRGGFNSIWNLGCGFGLFGDAETSLIWGRYLTRAIYTNTDIGSRYVHENLVPTFEVSLGLVWANCFADGSEIRLKGGWEGFYYYDQTVNNLEPQLVSHPLTLQGLVISVSYSM